MTATAEQRLYAAMATQANFMKGSLATQVEEMFPDLGDPGLVVTGFVFRPVEDEDLEDEESEDVEENLYVYEAHFNATTHTMVGNLSTKLLMHLEECETLAEAQARFVDLVAKNQAPGPEKSLQERIDAHWGNHPKWPADAVGCNKGCTPQRQGFGVGCLGNENGESCAKFWLKGDKGGPEILAFMDARDQWEKEHRELEKLVAESGGKVAL